MFGTIRIVVGVVSALFLLIGLFMVVGGGPPVVTGLWLLAMGGAGLVVVAFERVRYRSEAAEISGEPAGVAGVDDGPADARFTPTEERFIDPTTRRRLRVWVDEATGERRYRPDEEP